MKTEDEKKRPDFRHLIDPSSFRDSTELVEVPHPLFHGVQPWENSTLRAS
jgi:hypothetical protein